MTKHLLHILTFIAVVILSVSVSYAQTGFTNENNQDKLVVQKSIENLSIYPNPVTVNGKITIDTKSNDLKEIEIYNVVGKKIISTVLATKEYNLPNSVTSGIYIIKVRENNATATRKLIVK